MKKILLSGVATALLSTQALALVGNDIEVGMGVYAPTLSGHAGYGSQAATSRLDLGNAGLDEGEFSGNNYVYADFAHFIPLIPNFRFERLAYSHSGTSTQSINWNNKQIASQDVKLDIDLDQKDYILYWGVPLLETATLNTLQINFGIDIKNISGEVSLDDDSASFNETLPALHLDARVALPFLPVNLEAYMNTISYDGAELTNTALKVSGVFEMMAMDFRVDLGYRTNELIIPTSLVDDVDVELKSSGMFAGISAKF
jgi:outer membrane protein